ncbi:acetyltransf_18 domain-containing protein [Trichonephila inaurata madagascariensis]|uniref:Acetyltransf_18 domain-containing protein n=1 Tax=Trichonephila inaurata madagascariensis TaxID=2747483 RepID=A0A8X7BNM5_9ARAC|nr:acetyltransf_18 domain-containing protein [Trichonephila inaurata madagascariensis]
MLVLRHSNPLRKGEGPSTVHPTSSTESDRTRGPVPVTIGASENKMEVQRDRDTRANPFSEKKAANLRKTQSPMKQNPGKREEPGEREGEVIGVCCAVIHHPNLAFVGVYAVREKYRGCGIGKEVWDKCMKHVENMNVVINAVPDKVLLYRDKGGFPILETEWACVVNETEEPINHEALSNEVPDGVEIVPFQDSHLPAMFEYDLALIGYDRKLALELNCKEFDSKTFVAFKDGKCVGFGTIKRSCHNVGQVGPLYADDPAVAEVMLRTLIESHPDVKGFAMMTISSNVPANNFIKKIGCPTTEECPRLYRKEKVEVDKSKVIAHFDLNFCPY